MCGCAMCVDGWGVGGAIYYCIVLYTVVRVCMSEWSWQGEKQVPDITTAEARAVPVVQYIHTVRTV